MYFKDQKTYEEYHSPEQREKRIVSARRETDIAVAEALGRFNSGDINGARNKLFDAGISEDGVVYYLSAWAN